MKFVLLIVSLFNFISCNFPRDPEDSLKQIHGATLRVGVSQDYQLVWMKDNLAEGEEAELIKEFAKTLNAKVEWFFGSESQIIHKLNKYELHLGIGGFTKKSPWKSKVGFSTDYDKHGHVIAVPPGENRMLIELEKFLKGRIREKDRKLGVTG